MKKLVDFVFDFDKLIKRNEKKILFYFVVTSFTDRSHILIFDINVLLGV